MVPMIKPTIEEVLDALELLLVAATSDDDFDEHDNPKERAIEAAEVARGARHRPLRDLEEYRLGPMSAETDAALRALTKDEIDVFPLNVQPDARPRVRLAHIESGEGAPVGQGRSVVSVPSKYERLAWFMVCAANDAFAASRAPKG